MLVRGVNVGIVGENYTCRISRIIHVGIMGVIYTCRISRTYFQIFGECRKYKDGEIQTFKFLAFLTERITVPLTKTGKL